MSSNISDSGSNHSASEELGKVLDDPGLRLFIILLGSFAALVTIGGAAWALIMCLRRKKAESENSPEGDVPPSESIPIRRLNV